MSAAPPYQAFTPQLELPGFAATRPVPRWTFSAVLDSTRPPCGFLGAYDRGVPIGGWLESDESGTWSGFWYREMPKSPPEHVWLDRRRATRDEAAVAVVRAAIEGGGTDPDGVAAANARAIRALLAEAAG